MGPRLVSRGKPPNNFPTDGILKASMGPRLVSRGKHALGKKAQARLRLQWGRDLLVAESETHRGTPVKMDAASMGPRLVSRGKSATLHRGHQKTFGFNGAATC